MKKYIIVIIGLLCIVCFIFFTRDKTEMPFSDLKLSDIKSVQGTAMPPYNQKTFTDEEKLTEFVSALNEITTKKQDSSWQIPGGQVLEYIIYMKDGTSKKVIDGYTYIIIDDVSYKIDYDSNFSLNQFGDYLQ